MSEKNEVMEAIGDAVAERVPQIVADALAALADKQEDPLVASVVEITAAFVAANGAEAFQHVTDMLQKIIDGDDPLAVFRYEGDGLFLSDLVDALQSAESGRRKRASRMNRALGIALKDIGKVVSEAVIAAFA